MAPQNTDPARAAESNLGYLLGVTATFHAVALVFVAMRLYARVIIVKAFGKDDALIIASTVRRYDRSCSTAFLTMFDRSVFFSAVW